MEEAGSILSATIIVVSIRFLYVLVSFLQPIETTTKCITSVLKSADDSMEDMLIIWDLPA